MIEPVKNTKQQLHMENRKLNRKAIFDDNSRNYPIRELLDKPLTLKGDSILDKLIIKLQNITDALENISSDRKRRIERLEKRKKIIEDKIAKLNAEVIETTPNKLWECVEYLDQGTEGACVGFAWTHELNATPFVIPVKTETARTIYYAAQQWDVWDGTDYDGTSVLAGAKVVYSIGHMEEYRWAFGIDDVVDTLLKYGPLVLGVNWYEGMFDTNSDGFITPTGNLSGGHAILANGIDVEDENGNPLPEPVIRLHNSWGKDWGVNGDAFITKSDLDKLLKEQGEACVPVKRQ